MKGGVKKKGKEKENKEGRTLGKKIEAEGSALPYLRARTSFVVRLGPHETSSA